jgi:hypothetical protein
MFSVNSLSSGLRNKIESTAFGDIFSQKGSGESRHRNFLSLD